MFKTIPAILKQNMQPSFCIREFDSYDKRAGAHNNCLAYNIKRWLMYVCKKQLCDDI